MARRKKRRRSRDPAPLAPWWRAKSASSQERSGPLDRPPRRAEEVVPALVGAKLRVLRLLRAIDGLGIDVGAWEDLPRRLAAAIQVDGFLTTMLHLATLDDPDAESPPVPLAAELVETAGDMVEFAIDGIPGVLAERLRAGMDEAAGAEPEVWLEVDGMRRACAELPEDEGPQADTLPEELELDDIERESEAIEAILRSDAPALAADEDVLRIEATPLPRSRAARPLLRTLPSDWLRTIARMHRLDPEEARDDLVASIATALADPNALVQILGEGLGPSERRLLAALVIDGPVEVPDVEEPGGFLFAVGRDWSIRLPPSEGGRLRAFGLAFVGRVDGCRTVVAPADVEASIRDALERLDPEALQEPDGPSGPPPLDLPAGALGDLEVRFDLPS